MELFASEGFAGASVEAIAARAGFTRGAFYAHFADKEAAFFSLMDERMEQRSLEIASLLAGSTPLDFFEALRTWSTANRDADGGARLRLFAEFRAYAMRSESARLRLVERDRASRDAFRRAIEAQFAAAGIAPPAPAAQLAVIVHALDVFLPVEHALDPESVPESFFIDAIALLFRAAIALSEATP